MSKFAKKIDFHLAVLFIGLVVWLILDYLLFARQNIILMIVLLVLPFIIGIPTYYIVKMKKAAKRVVKSKEIL